MEVKYSVAPNSRPSSVRTRVMARKRPQFSKR
jgi:hypothetical protein